MESKAATSSNDSNPQPGLPGCLSFLMILYHQCAILKLDQHSLGVNPMPKEKAERFTDPFANDVWRLSQDEGLFDYEIAEQLQTYRVKVSRCRKKFHIPRPKLANRRDKEHKCYRCGKTRLIRRRQRAQGLCPDCRAISRENLLERKRIYMRGRIKEGEHHVIQQ